MAERELSAFFNAVKGVFGPEQPELSAEDWLHELTEIDGLPDSSREWRLITTRVSTRLASRVNASSLSTVLVRPSNVSLEEMRAVWDTNVFGVLAVYQAMLPLLRQAPAARIVNVSSGAGSLTLNSDPTHPHRAVFGPVYPRLRRLSTL
jgi:NAD(P)-dependent dehydrogenase (short-subunit alcohol dehydrogenase family)